ncbi:MAG: SAM-dependent methyltransferase [Kofleriaceae bacterium]|nr:SAM-dependent methyltransferase [Kofleriaceae bacterium]MCB9573017.1 SAM-dependent methyltransferase [Kofleriaceae bacterium]
MRKKVDRADVAAELWPGVSIELLQDLHLLTRGGDLNADSRRKVKQIRHLLGLLTPALDDVLARHPEPIVVDAGAGKSYLGFLLQETVLGPAGRGAVWSIEARAELVAAAEDRARRLGHPTMRFVAGDIATAPVPDRVHLVTALHACDTATDDTLLLAIRRGADHVAVVPCCQAEVARQLAAHRPDDDAAAALCAHPWHRRELGSHLTNVIRALALEARGYQVTVTELAGWEHSLKNELILGRRVARFDRGAQARLDAVLARFGVRPALIRGLDELGAAA